MGTIDCLGWAILIVGFPPLWRVFGSIPGLEPLDSRSNPPLSFQNQKLLKLLPDIAKYPWGTIPSLGLEYNSITHSKEEQEVECVCVCVNACMLLMHL